MNKIALCIFTFFRVAVLYATHYDIDKLAKISDGLY